MFNQNKLKAQMALKNISARELAKRMEINESTLYRKIQNDGNFTRSEINLMISILDIKDPADIFFAEELA